MANGASHSTTASFPSNSPASPHRAGHYSGLHPEDQPYQSSFMPILRPPAITRRVTDQTTEDVLEPVAVSSAPLQETLEDEVEQTPKRYVASPVPVPVQLPQRSAGTLTRTDTPPLLREVEPFAPVQESTLHEQFTAQFTAPLPVSALATGGHRSGNRAARIFFVAAILLFLLASSILTYLVVFTGRGSPAHQAASSVHPGNQQALSAAPQMQLSTSHIDFGEVSVQNSFVLTNAGGQQVNWQAGVDSNSSWLSITPTFGTFTQKETVIVTIQRSNLAPRVYTGYINFFQQGTNKPLTLTVTMSVTTLNVTATASLPPITQTAGPTPLPGMALTTNALSFNAIQGKNPAQQAFTLTNTGNAPLNWAITGDANANALLSLSSTSGSVAPGSSVQITVSPNVSTATAGVINAVLTVHDTDPGTQLKSQQVAVKITISKQALISVSTTNIACKLSSTVTTSSQPFNITNTGSATLNWVILPQSLPAWISIDFTSGTLPPGYTAFLTIACNNTGFQTGTYTFKLVVSDTGTQTPVAPQNVLVTLTVS